MLLQLTAMDSNVDIWKQAELTRHALMMDSGGTGPAHRTVRQVQLYVDYKHKLKTHKVAQSMIQLLMMPCFTAVTFLIHVTSERYGSHKFLSLLCLSREHNSFVWQIS